MGWRDRIRGKSNPQDTFAEEVARLVPQLVPVNKVERGEDFSLEISLVDGMRRVLFLQNIFAEASRLDGAAREQLLRRAVLAVTTGTRPSSWADAETRLMPSLRSAGWAAASASGGRTPLRKVFAPFVMLLLAIDDEHGMSFVTDEDAQSWGVDWMELATAAFNNLANTEIMVGAPPDSPWLEVLGPDGYASSWLVLPHALEQFAQSLGDDFVAVAKARDSLRLIATADRAALAAELEHLLQEYLSEPRQLSPVPFAVRDGDTVIWEPDPGDPCRPLVDRLHRMLALNEYRLQLNVLTDLFQKSGVDVFVARFTLMERDDKTVWSWCAWPRQVSDGLLPRTDYLCLGDLDAKANIWVRWEDAERLAGDALQAEPGYFPARWRIHGWPDPSVMASLQAAAVDPATDDLR